MLGGIVISSNAVLVPDPPNLPGAALGVVVSRPPMM